MKVKIIKMASGGPTPKQYTFKPYGGDKYASKKGKAGWNASQMSEEELHNLAKELRYTGPDTVEGFQNFILNNPDPQIRQRVDELHKQYGMPNAGKEADNYWGIRWDVYKNLLKKPEPDPVFDENTPAPEGQDKMYDTSGNKFTFEDKGSKKEPYEKRRLPFYQAAPDLAAFVEAQNTYNYYTPDYNHWEVSPATMNIQPQLNEINAGANGYYKTTTGSPQLDTIRKQSAFASSLNAKQVAYGQKQNYDANMRYQADVQNINARTQEQNADIAATENVHNNYRALAKDFAAGERLRSINSLTRKYASNEANENQKKLWLDNFFPNFTSNGINSIDKTDSDANFNYNYYNTKPKSKISELGENVTPSEYESIRQPDGTVVVTKKKSAAPSSPFAPVNNKIIPQIQLDENMPELDPSLEFDPVRTQMMKPIKYNR